MSERYVILHHTGVDEPHFDLMLEGVDQLWTWACQRNPMELDAGDHSPAQPLLDHRKEYLEYEGPIRGGRGEVKQISRGEYRLLGREEGLWRVSLKAHNEGHAVVLHVGQTAVHRK